MTYAIQHLPSRKYVTEQRFLYTAGGGLRYIVSMPEDDLRQLQQLSTFQSLGDALSFVTTTSIHMGEQAVPKSDLSVVLIRLDSVTQALGVGEESVEDKVALQGRYDLCGAEDYGERGR